MIPLQRYIADFYPEGYNKPGASTVASLFKLLSALDLDLVLKPKSRDPEGRGAKAKQPKPEW